MTVEICKRTSYLYCDFCKFETNTPVLEVKEGTGPTPLWHYLCDQHAQHLVSKSKPCIDLPKRKRAVKV